MSIKMKLDRFGIVKHIVLTDPEISIQAKGLYSVLCCYANANRVCWPSLSTLADVTDTSQSSIKRYLSELKTHNIIHREGRKLRII
jgi:hypothetical protein